MNGDFYYNLDFLKSLENLYINKVWKYKDINKSNNLYLFPIFVKPGFNMFNIDIEYINKLLDKYGVNTLRIDNINSDYQQDNYKRLFMYDIDDKNNGLIIRNKIYEYLKFINKL